MTTTSVSNDLYLERRATTKEQVRDLLNDLERLEKEKQDFILDSRQLLLDVVDGEVQAIFPEPGRVTGTLSIAHPIRNTAHSQLATLAKVPLDYYRRCVSDAPDLAAVNINRWLPQAERLQYVRTLGGQVRAVLSNAYKVLDGIDLFFAAFDGARGNGGQITAVSVSERNFTVELTDPNRREKIESQYMTFRQRRGGQNETMGRGHDAVALADLDADYIVPYVTCSTSEVGQGGLKVETGMERLTCSNGLTSKVMVSKVHRGSRQNAGYISEETRRAEARLIFNEVRDAVCAAFDEDEFKKLVANLNEAANMEITEPVKVIEEVAKTYVLTEGERERLLNEFMNPTTNINPGPTVYGLSQALTWLSHTTESVDRRYELERAGGDIIAHRRELVAVRR